MRTRTKLRRLSRLVIARARPLFQSERERRIEAWIAAGNDRTLRLDYDLEPGSVVLDVGGFAGQWASDIYARFRCRVHVFEPVVAFAEGIETRFARNADIRVHRFGLGATTRREAISVAGVGSTLLARPGRRADRIEQVRIVAASDFLRDEGIDDVALVKINIEGGEYELLAHLLDAGLIERFRDVQVQFHDFVSDAERRMTELQARLGATHRLTWQERYIWENWRRLDATHRAA